MVMADYRQASRPRAAMRGEQRGGIDFEFSFRGGSHIGAGLRRRDSSFRSEQQAANLAIRHSVRIA